MKRFFHKVLFCLKHSGCGRGTRAAVMWVLCPAVTFWKLPEPPRRSQSKGQSCCVPRLLLGLSEQLASRVQCLSWLLLYFSGYFLASLWSLFHCQPACELSGADILTNKMTLWKTDPRYWHISKTDGDLGKGKKSFKRLATLRYTNRCSILCHPKPYNLRKIWCNYMRRECIV